MARGGLISGNAADPYVNLEPGDNTKFLQTALKVTALGRNRVDIMSKESVETRVNEYFAIMLEDDKKPTWTGFCNALGVNRGDIDKIMKNLPWGNSIRARRMGYTDSGVPEEVRSLLNGIHNMFAALWEDYMQNGKINPASGIFLGKNFYGMKDQVDHVVTAETKPIDNYSAEDIASRYISDTSQSETPPNKRKKN